MKKCVICKKEFFKKYKPKQKTCSIECRAKRQGAVLKNTHKRNINARFFN